MDNPETKQKALLGTTHRTRTNKTKKHRLAVPASYKTNEQNMVSIICLSLINQKSFALIGMKPLLCQIIKICMAIVIFFKTNVEMKIENINSRM